MQPNEKLKDILADLQHFIEQLQRFVDGKGLNDFATDELLYRAVNMQFVLIGEAMRRLRHLSVPVAERISNVQKIAGFRNILVHEYDSVDDERVWTTVRRDIPLLKEQIDSWIAEIER